MSIISDKKIVTESEDWDDNQSISVTTGEENNKEREVW